MEGGPAATVFGIETLRLHSTPPLYILPPHLRARVELFSFDQAYLVKLRERDFRTEQHFVGYFRRLLLIKLRSRLGSSSAVDDICQETFVRVLRALQTEGGIRSPERLGAFVNSVCNNVLQEFYRASQHGDPSQTDAAEPTDPAVDMLATLVTQQTRMQVRQILLQLPEKDRRLLRSVFLEEKDKDEVCRDFGVDRDYLRVLLHRAKESFREVYVRSQSAGRVPARP